MKKRIDDLAIFGGKPLFENTLHVGAPNIGDRHKLFNRINNMLDTRRLTNRGPYVRELESKLADYLGVKHVIAMCNGTVALEIAIRALELKGEVIVPSMTFVATAHALQWQEIRPTFVDVDPKTHLIDPERIEALITPNTTGIIGVHLWGHPCPAEPLQEIANKHNLKLLFDAAHAFAVTQNGQRVGNFGDAEVFSFHATKVFNSFEGGAVATNSDDLAEKIRLMQNFGFAGKDTVIYIGTNGKMSEVSAAMGLTSLESLEQFISHNRGNYEIYQQALQKIAGCSLLPYNYKEKNNYQYIVTEIDDEVTAISRDTIMHILHAENIIARRYFYPGSHRMEPYRSFQPNAGLLLQNTERLVERVLVLPTGTQISKSDIEKIVALIEFIVENGLEINKKIGTSFKKIDEQSRPIKPKSREFLTS